jgi:hypothetical protein
MSLREVAEGHRTGEGDMNCLMCFPKLNSYRDGYCFFILFMVSEDLKYLNRREQMRRGLKSLLAVFLIFLCAGTIWLTAQDQPGAEAAKAAEVNATPQATAPTAANDSAAGKVGGVLLIFLVLSIVFESALTPIFNWRFFLTHFDGKGLKTPVTIILALLVFWNYDLDIFSDLLVALGYTAAKSFWGQVLTALLIAGGSNGILQIFIKLNIRDPGQRKKEVEADARGKLSKKQGKKTDLEDSQ